MAAGRIFWGWFSDLVGREMAMFIPFTLQALCLVGGAHGRQATRATWFIADHDRCLLHLGQHVLALSRRSLATTTAPKCATSNYGFLYTAKGVASIGGGGIAAMLFMKFGNWNAAFYMNRCSHLGFRIADSGAALLAAAQTEPG